MRNPARRHHTWVEDDEDEAEASTPTRALLSPPTDARPPALRLPPPSPSSPTSAAAAVASAAATAKQLSPISPTAAAASGRSFAATPAVGVELAEQWSGQSASGRSFGGGGTPLEKGVASDYRGSSGRAQLKQLERKRSSSHFHEASAQRDHGMRSMLTKARRSPLTSLRTPL